MKNRKREQWKIDKIYYGQQEDHIGTYTINLKHLFISITYMGLEINNNNKKAELHE